MNQCFFCFFYLKSSALDVTLEMNPAFWPLYVSAAGTTVFHSNYGTNTYYLHVSCNIRPFIYYLAFK